MNKIKSTVCFCILNYLLSAPVFAVSGESGWMKISQIRPYAQGAAVVYVEGSFTAVNCDNATAYRIDDASGPAGSHLYSAVLAAFVAGKDVRAYFTGECTPSMNRVEYLTIR